MQAHSTKTSPMTLGTLAAFGLVTGQHSLLLAAEFSKEQRIAVTQGETGALDTQTLQL